MQSSLTPAANGLAEATGGANGLQQQSNLFHQGIKESRNQGIKTKNASQQNSDKGNAAQASSNKNDVDANVKINIACTKQCRGG
ncbi:hypothetical protein [Synechococcus sp. MIT S9451]|uniref:hypothetical protein n=1 Tax=Synechococcus sp. MIT S9451 TaxID=3082543 RepID=UPI0039B60040